jgi:hypothetical protein
MKHLKTYKLFESFNNVHFPTENEIKELFIELYDDEILFQPLNNYTYGYVFFPYDAITGQLLQQFNYAVENHADWENLRPDILHGDRWSDLFLDVNDERNHYMLEKCQDWIFIEQKDISQTTKLIWENIENGKILAYPVIKFYLGYFKTKNKELVFEALERLYDATDFRPTREVWEEDFVDEDTGDLIDVMGMDLTFYNVDDETYRNLTKVFSYRELEKELVKHFIN